MCNLIFIVMLVMVSLFGMVVQVDDYIVGKEYVELSSLVLVFQLGKIEVVELFWYGCLYCYVFELIIVLWSEKLLVDVYFVCLFVLFGGIWNVYGQMFLILESMGVEYDVYNVVFEVIYKEYKKFVILEEMVDFFVGKGVDKEKFLSIYNFFVIKGQMEKVKKLVMVYQVIGVLIMVVNGKYCFDIGFVGGLEEIFKLVDYLIEKECVVVKKQVR